MGELGAGVGRVATSSKKGGEREEDPHKSFTSLNFRKIPSTSVISPIPLPVQLPLLSLSSKRRARLIGKGRSISTE